MRIKIDYDGILKSLIEQIEIKVKLNFLFNSKSNPTYQDNQIIISAIYFLKLVFTLIKKKF